MPVARVNGSAVQAYRDELPTLMQPGQPQRRVKTTALAALARCDEPVKPDPQAVHNHEMPLSLCEVDKVERLKWFSLPCASQDTLLPMAQGPPHTPILKGTSTSTVGHPGPKSVL
jgi:hypothetical protein